ncbi:MAG TPA: radical SAM protein [Methanospirillum sp.]|uniref:radical SAM/SPASM domain-containing protein n=1 Tax=Methanospirillum sp. TaxID=45200 RepID=UPI002B8C5BD4|nr:radical SAM protein [Methanospirillum sp.]HOJ97460.1 radical SAM protein [Methanospirillum sp.]
MTGREYSQQNTPVSKPAGSSDIPPDLYRDLFNSTIGEVIHHAIRIIGGTPSLIIPAGRILRYQKKAANIRAKHEKEGLLVPPVLIISITARCNLTCARCYMHARKENQKPEMSPAMLTSIIDQARALGVSIIVIAGGEPFVRAEEIIRIAQNHPAILFPVFTNGLLIDEPLADTLASCRNIVPMISVEGLRDETDARRGNGVFDRLFLACHHLKSRDIFFGCSITTTSANYETVTRDVFIRQMIDASIRVFSYVEYVPMTPGTEELVLTHKQKQNLPGILARLNQKYPALFLGFPGDEAYYGGCLAAGRGFVHVSPSGDLEPCPAASYSDANLTEMSLKEGLKSPFLQRLRDIPELLTESAGGCALHENEDMVRKILSKP